LNKTLWIGVPVLLILIQLGIEVFLSGATKELLLQEGGPHETLQAVVMFLAFIMATYLTARIKGKWLKLWFGIAALASLYVAGEKVSWGQWIFYWDTPEHWAALNDQNETNLHNTSSWFDQKPQILLQIGVLVGGIIIPLLKIFNPAKLPEKFNAIYGDYQLLPTALIALSLKITDTLCDAFHLKFFWRISEVLELYLFYFVALYLYTMIRKHFKATETP